MNQPRFEKLTILRDVNTVYSDVSMRYEGAEGGIVANNDTE
jgi:hypothetical protein